MNSWNFSGQLEIKLTTLRQKVTRMHAPLRKSICIAASAAIAFLAMGTTYGQAAKVTSDPPSFDNLPSPEFAGVKNKSFKPLNWLEIEARLNIILSPMPLSKTCEKVSIKWYVAVKNPEKPKGFLLLTKTIDHVNVPLGEDVYCSIFLSPASLRRISGTDNAGKNAVELVGYEVLINGEKVAQGTNKSKPGWWNTASESISRSETVPLLSKSETPFRDMWWDRYPEISVERR
jgi:hypothetical protein